MTKKAQAAMEFLVTYGWVILAIIIVAAFIWIFLTGECGKKSTGFLSQDIVITDWAVYNDGNLTVAIANRAPSYVTVYQINKGSFVGSPVIEKGDSSSFDPLVDYPGGKKAGTCYKNLELAITYQPKDKLNHTITGTISGSYEYAPSSGSGGGGSGGNISNGSSDSFVDYQYKRDVTFTEDKNIARNNPYLITFNPNNNVQSDCDDVIVTYNEQELASNIKSCSSSKVEVAFPLTLSPSEEKTFTVFYSNSTKPTPGYRTNGSEPIVGRIVFTGVSSTCECGNSKSAELHSEVFDWSIQDTEGLITCSSGQQCDQADVQHVNDYAGTTYNYSTGQPMNNYDLIMTGYRWNKNGDYSEAQYLSYLQQGGSLFFTGHDGAEVPFTTTFLPEEYDVSYGERQLSCTQFICSSSDTSHQIGDPSFCGDWGYSCQTMNSIDANSNYYKIWSTGNVKPILVVAGLDSPYNINEVVGPETPTS
ncbi:MAG: hypothetical protein HYS32_03985 [Candidatus Woesearchaeota archaeon]|nr:MAG: hypothetical protein HYS32_03985 [Candidatus Woesearchaeota archaeon]